MTDPPLSSRPSARADAFKPKPPNAHAGDTEMLELIAEFLSESEDGLDQVEEALATAESSEATRDQVHLIFRLYHTIKGTSGFLDVPDVVALAHSTENVLREVREGTLALAGPVLELVAASTSLMRDLLEDVRLSVETGGELRKRPRVAAMLTMLANAEKGSVTREQAVQPSQRPVREPSLAPLREQSLAPLAQRSLAPAAREGEARLAETLKVDVTRIDTAVELIGALIVAESAVMEAPEVTSIQSPHIRRALHQIVKLSSELYEVGMRMRMIPVRAVFQKLGRMARDLSKKTKKPLRFEVDGEETEVDRGMVELLQGPLVHLLRNSIDHGIEPPEERQALGKPLAATLRLSASQDGAHIVVSVRDDGRGLQREKILNKARERGIIRPDATLSDDEIHALIMAPGFSTASQVTEISGRGVGMDVVKQNVEALRGRIHITSVEGKGTNIRLVLPLTLAVVDGTLVTCGDESYVIPSAAIVESLRPAKEMLNTLGNETEFIRLREQLIPLQRLARIFQARSGQEDATQAIAVIVESQGRKSALLVDDIVAQRQVVVKPLYVMAVHTEHFSGATILPDGRPGLIIDIDRLCRAPSARTSEQT